MRKMWLAAALVSIVGLAPAFAQDYDKKTVEKMLADGTKKLSSPDAEERETGADYILGYIRCSDRAKYGPILVKALKDTNPKVRVKAAQALEKIQAAEAVPDLVALLQDSDEAAQERAAYALGGLGAAAKSAQPALEKARAAAQAAGKSRLEGAMENALGEIAGTKDGKRYSCS